MLQSHTGEIIQGAASERARGGMRGPLSKAPPSVHSGVRPSCPLANTYCSSRESLSSSSRSASLPTAIWGHACMRAGTYHLSGMPVCMRARATNNSMGFVWVKPACSSPETLPSLHTAVACLFWRHGRGRRTHKASRAAEEHSMHGNGEPRIESVISCRRKAGPSRCLSGEA